MQSNLKPDRMSKEAKKALAIATYGDFSSRVTNITAKLSHDTDGVRHAYLKTGIPTNTASVETTVAGIDSARVS